MVSLSLVARFLKFDVVRSFAFIFWWFFFKIIQRISTFVSYFSFAGFITLKYCILSYSLQVNLSVEAALPQPSMLPLCIRWDLAVEPDSQMVPRLPGLLRKMFSHLTTLPLPTKGKDNFFHFQWSRIFHPVSDNQYIFGLVIVYFCLQYFNTCLVLVFGVVLRQFWKDWYWNTGLTWHKHLSIGMNSQNLRGVGAHFCKQGLALVG